MKLWKWFLLGLLILIIGLGAYTYFTLLSPSFVKKPQLNNPLNNPLLAKDVTNVTNQTEIKEEHLQYLVNEIGAYKLHEDPATKTPPTIEIYVTDKDIYYTAIIKDNYPEVTKGKAQNPDLRLHATQIQLILLLQAENFEQTVIDKALAGDLKVEILTSEKTLALKGYKGIYDTLNKEADIPITGNSIAQLDTDWWDIIKSRQDI